MRPPRFFSTLFALLLLPAALSAGPLPKGKGKVEIKEEPGKLRIEIGGKLFSEYVFENTSRPYLFPIIGPTGAGMTRNWPMKEVTEKEERDHPHHKGWWYTHGDVNGVDFWSEAKGAGKTVHDGFVEVKSGDVGIIKSKNKLIANDGKVVATDVRTLKIYNVQDAALFDFEYTLNASNGDVTLGDTKEGTMAIRLAESMRLKQKAGPGEGHIVNSEGVKDAATWGKRAKWVDYYGPVHGQTVGVAIFDHPSNPRYPTWWHVRDYGLFAANPFGIHDFEKKEKGAGNMLVKSGGSVTFRYRFYFHKGNEVEGKVAEQFAEFAK